MVSTGIIAIQGIQRPEGNISGDTGVNRMEMEGKALEEPKSRLRQKALAGLTATGHAGIGYLPAIGWTRVKTWSGNILFRRKCGQT